jgi:glutathione peroxidase
MVAKTHIFFSNIVTWVQHRFSKPGNQAPGSIYDFKVTSLKGELIDFARYRGKKLLIVNTASKCSYTKQYEDLQQLHERYSGKLTVLGFPANDFLWQERGTNQDIAEFCSINYGVTFQMFEKITVKGRSMHPLFKWLKLKSGKEPTWNFSKYLIDEKGNVMDFFQPNVNPLDQKIIDKIST